MAEENELTVGAWLDLFEEHPGSAMERAWTHCSGSRDGDSDGEVLLRLVGKEAAAARRFDRGRPLRLLWMGIRRNIHREELRSGRRARPLPDALSAAGPDRKAYIPPFLEDAGAGRRESPTLTAHQCRVVRSALLGWNASEMAMEFGLSRGAVLDRMARAVRRLDGTAAGNEARGREFNAAQSEGARGWARRIPAGFRRDLSVTCRCLLDEYAAGLPLHDLAGSRGISIEAVRCRIRRLRRKVAKDD